VATHATLFVSNRTQAVTQAVRLPKAVACDASVREVTILRDGPRRIIVPACAVWGDFFDAPGIDLGARDQPAPHVRDDF
jgi:antitoxin VapB